jgi:iron complex outermembrane receptor protein
LLYQVSRNAKLLLTAGFSDSSDATGIAYTVHHSLASLYHDAFGVPQIYTETPYKTSFSHPIALGPKEWSLSLSGAFEAGWADFTSRTVLRNQRNHMWSDQDGTSIPFWNGDFQMRLQTISQEFGVAGANNGPLQWRAGLFLSNDLNALHHNSSQDIFSTGVATSLFHSDLRVATDSVGLFGETNYAATENLLVTAGGRFSHERKSMRSRYLLTTPPTDGADVQSWDDFSPRLALRRALGPDANLYASVAQGFKSGNYNFLGVGPQPPVKAQHVTQYEAGYKQATAGWTLDAALYLSNIRDLQISTYVASCACFQLYNAPRAQSYGAELSATHAFDENFSFNAAGAWTHARYRQFIGEGATGQPYVPPVYGYATGPTDFAGSPMLYSPDWTGNAGFAWHAQSDAGRWNAAANLYLTSRVSFAPGRQLSQAGYALLNLSLGWTAPNALWSVTASAENVTGRRYQAFSSLSFLGQSTVYGAPESWSLRVEQRF